MKASGPHDRYRRLRLLGEGGGGRVWLVEDRERQGLRLALKEASPAHADGTTASEALRREFALLASFSHPGLVEVFDFEEGQPPAGSRFTMEYVRGEDFLQAARRGGAEACLEWSAEFLRLLGFLHEAGVCHGDLKPSNLKVRSRPKLGCRVVLLDFGLAWFRPAPGAPPQGPHAGTLLYAAPERLAGEPVSPRTDLFAAGGVIYEAVYGRPPGAGGEPGAETRRLMSPLPPRVPQPPAPYPAGLASWLTCLLHPDPSQRPASAREALERLNEATGTRFPWSTPPLRAARLGSGEPAERASVLARLRGVLRQHGVRLVWLAGPPGYGKSRLLRRLEVEALLEGRAVTRDWRALARALEAPRATGAAGSPRETRTLVLLDDADEAPPEVLRSLELVAFARDAPCTVVAGTTPHPQRRALARLLSNAGRIAGTARVDLPPLDAPALEAMARRATGGSVAPQRVRWLLEVSGGVPAVAEAALIEEGWERERELAPDALGRLGPRWGLLSSEAQRWTLALALLGEATEPELEGLLDLDTEQVRTLGEEALAAGLARRQARGWRIASTALAQVIAGSAAESPSLARRAALGRQGAMKGEPTEPEAARLARLWAAAGDSRRARAWAARAAREALAAADPEAAVGHWRLALRVTGRARAARYRLRRRQGEACARAGLHREAARAFGAAARLAPDHAARAQALVRQAEALVHAGRFAAAIATASRAETMASHRGLADVLREARRVRGIALARLGHEDEAIPLLEACRAALEAAGAGANERAVLEHQIGACRLRLGDSRAEENFQRVMQMVRGVPGGELTAEGIKARIGLAVVAARQGRHEAARGALEEARGLARRAGHLALEEACLSKLAALALDTGHYEEAIGHAERACDLALRLGDANALVVNRALLADTWIRCGRPGDAVALLRETLEGAGADVEPENLDYARMLLAHGWIELGEAARAEVGELLRDCLERSAARRGQRARLVALALEVERAAALGALEALAAAAGELARVLETGPQALEPELEIRAQLALARSELAQGHVEQAAKRSGRAEARAREAKAFAFAAEAAALAATACERAGKLEEAVRAQHRGREALDQACGQVEDRRLREDLRTRRVFASLERAPEPADAGREHGRLRVLYDMIRALNSQADPERVVESMLDMALRALGAERGIVLLRDTSPGAAADNFTIHTLREIEEETVRDATAFSRTVVAAAGRGESLLAVDTGTDARVRELPSVTLHGIRSLMCVPLRSRGRIIGTVYLDTRSGGRTFSPEDLRFLEAFADHAALALENAQVRRALEVSNAQLRRAAEARTEFANIVGASPAMQRVFDLIERFVQSPLPVLIRGESGTGKELVARALHFQGPRRRGPFVCENCAAIPESLLESELFGHARGAFTGAERDRPGLWEQAHGGTLFLDEIGDMSLAMQARVLRAIETGETRRVGEERPRHVDARVVAATHRDLEHEVRAGRFREDLLYRLQVLVIELPPLRERPGDIPLLVEHFLERIGRERGRRPPRVTADVLALFERYSWPGNVRQLQNVLLRLALLAGEGAITMGLVESDAALRRTLLGEPASMSPVFSLDAGERAVLRRALEASRGNRAQAARLLGISRATLYRKLQRHGLSRR